jgi:hypothetical protein
MKDLPKSLRDGFQAALNDEELVALRDELALLDVDTKRLLARLSPAEAPPWGEAVEALNDVITAGDEAERNEKLAALAQLVREGAAADRSEEETWREVREVIRVRTRTAAAEWKRQIDLRAVVPVEQAILFVNTLMGIIVEIYGRDERLSLLQRRLAAMAPVACERR